MAVEETIMAITDEKLLNAALDGDEAAEQAIIDQLTDEVWGYECMLETVEREAMINQGCRPI